MDEKNSLEFDGNMGKQFLMPLEVKNKENIFWDIREIDMTITTLIDAMFANRFISEACILLFNSVSLLELGYFDSAFYSLRQAIEISTTMCYLVELEKSERKTELKKWNSEGKFKLKGQMEQALSKFEKNFYELKEVFSDKFALSKDISRKLNKYVHKQGNDKLYTYMHSLVALEVGKNKIAEDFEIYLKEIIGIVAIMRLVIDPLPVLLNDEEIYHRTGEFMTEAYTDKFIEKYIGFDAIKRYRKTTLYSDYYSNFINLEKQSEDISWIRKYQVLDTEKIPQIKKQLHLLSIDDQIAVFIFEQNEKAIKVWPENNIVAYTTERKSLRGDSWNSLHFDNFAKAENPYNQEYEGVFISHFKLNNQYYQQGYSIEHNEKFSDSEISLLKLMIDMSAKKCNIEVKLA